MPETAAATSLQVEVASNSAAMAAILAAASGVAVALLYRHHRNKTPRKPEMPTRLGDDTAIVQVSQNVDRLRPKLGSFSRLASDGTGDFSLAGAGDCALFPDFLDTETARQMYDALAPGGGEVDYQQWFHMPDRKKPHKALRPLSRVKVAMTVGADSQGRWPLYRFPVNNQRRYGETRPMTPTVERVRQLVEKALDNRFTFNHAVVLFYRGLDDCIGFHRDKTLDLVPGAPIVSVSLGCERVYMLRDRIWNPTTTQAFVFPHGAMFCLGSITNEKFYHSIVKEVDENGTALLAPASAPHPQRLDFDTTARVSLTFRSVATFQDEGGVVYGQGATFQELDWPVSLNGQHQLDGALTEPLAIPSTSRN